MSAGKLPSYTAGVVKNDKGEPVVGLIPCEDLVEGSPGVLLMQGLRFEKGKEPVTFPYLYKIPRSTKAWVIESAGPGVTERSDAPTDEPSPE